jgi:hypothetical protein
MSIPGPNKGQVVASAWEDYVKQDPADNIFNYFWLLENLRVGDTFKKGAGDPITGTIEYQTNTTTKSMSELETLDVSRIDVFDRYEYAWKLVGGLIVMSDFERGQTAGAAGKFDLEAGKMENLKNSMMSQINTDLFSDGTGTSSKQAGGLQYIVSSTPTTGTVGAINRVNFSFWRNQQSSGAKSSTIYDNLKATMRTVYNNCSSGVSMQTPDFGVTDQTTFEGYESLSVTVERLNRTSTSDKLLSGYQGDHIMFKDIPIAYDRAAPSALMYILNRRNLFIRWMYWMKASPAVNPANQFADVVKILTVYNLVSDNPRRLGVITSTQS